MKFNNSLSIFGQGPSTISLAIKKALKDKAKYGAVLIMDYTGRGALIYDALLKPESIGPIAWFDLADRRCPVTLFNIRHSDRIRAIMLGVFQKINDISGYGLPTSVLEWCADATVSISKNGLISLSTIIKSLLSPDAYQWTGCSHTNPEGLGRFMEMLSWALAFPLVYAISEGTNKSRLSESLKNKEVIWIELQPEHFERLEYQLVMALLDASLEDTLSGYVFQQNKKDVIMTVVHLFPPQFNFKELPLWIKETSKNISHICVHNFKAEQALHPLQLAWATEAEKVWVMGKIDGLNKDAHRNWLSDKDMENIARLNSGNIWVQSNGATDGFTVKIGNTPYDIPHAYSLKMGQSKKLRNIPVRQMSSAARDLIKGYSCCDIYPKLCSREILRLGWLRVRNGRKESHGTDKVTIAMFKQNIENELFILENELKSRRYYCRPLRRCFIDKEDGSKRPIGIACVRDRVVQATCLILLEPVFEPIFSHRSFAFRPRRNAQQAVTLVKELIRTGKSWAVIADIKSCFDSIDHNILINLISEHIKDHDLLNLIRHWLNIEVLEFRDLFPIIAGVPQGESISPLFANIYLDQLDKHFEHQRLDFVRFADDIIILTETEDEAIAALQIMKDFLFKKLHLELKASKTNYVSVKQGFCFLGFHISINGIEIKRKRMDEISEVVRDKIRTLDNPSSTLEQKINAMSLINASIRGFRNYFFRSDEAKIIEQLKILEESINRMAIDYLSPSVIADPAWVQREKFYVKEMESTKNEIDEMKIQAVTAGYPNLNDKNDVISYSENHKGSEKSDNGIKRKNYGDDSLEMGTDGDSIFFEDNGRLYVLKHGSYLSTDEGDLIIKRKKIEIYRRHLTDLCLVFLQGMGMNISIHLQLKLAELDVPIVFAPPVGPPTAILNSVNSSSSFLRGIQALRRNDPEILFTGLNMLAAKTGNQAAVLNYFSKYRKVSEPEIGQQLSVSATKIKECSYMIKLLNPELADVRHVAMGLEGQAAAIYWQQITQILPTDLGFTGRITRAAKDMVNQCLNYVYGILYGEVWRAVVKAGLDPYFGIIHGSKKDQGSLVFDLIEEFRAPFADRLVIAMIGRGFQPKMGEYGFLRSKTRKQLAVSFLKGWYREITWRSQKITPAAILEKQASSLAKLFNQKGQYYAFKMRW